MVTQSILLIGPIAAGKTTVGEMLAAALKMTFLDIDEVRFDYYNRIGYDNDRAKQLFDEEGRLALIAYWKPFEAYAVECVVKDYAEDYVIAFGAGHSVYEDPALLERVRTALAPFAHVVFLLPTPDVAESAAILIERFKASEPDIEPEAIEAINEINQGFLTHPSNALLATHTLYTKGQTAEETRDAVLREIGSEEQST